MQSPLDLIFSFMARKYCFFKEGMGLDDAALQHLASRLLDPIKNIPLTIQWQQPISRGNILVRKGSFQSPAADELPFESQKAYVELISPVGNQPFPLVLHFAATGDQGFSRRRKQLAIPLAQRGIASLLLENPYYGRRRPQGQEGVSLKTFSDLMRMAQATVLEGLALLNHFESLSSRLAVTGVSMGGSMASLTGALYSKPLAIIPCLPAHSARVVFTEGAFRRACCFDKAPVDKVIRYLDASDIRRFNPPALGSNSILVAGYFDGVVPASSVKILQKHWKEASLWWLPLGHVGSFLWGRRIFLRAIEKALHRLPERPQ